MFIIKILLIVIVGIIFGMYLNIKCKYKSIAFTFNFIKPLVMQNSVRNIYF